MSRRRIAGVGAYVPRLSLASEAYAEAWGHGGPAGIDRTAVPDADEDSLTLAAEAGRRALSAADVDGEAVTQLFLATTTPPDDEGELTPRLASLLGVDQSSRTRQFGGGTRAGVAALADAAAAPDSATATPADAESTGPAGPSLVVVADCPSGAPESDEEAAAGAGAGAVVLAESGSMDVAGVGEFGEPYPGTRFRERGSAHVDAIGITAYEREAYRRTVGGAIETTLDGTGLAPADVDAVALTAPNGRLPYRVTAATGLSSTQVAAGTVVSETGDTGSAAPFLGLASALDSSAESVLLVGYGGGSDAVGVLLTGAATVPVDAALGTDVELSYPAYLRRRGTVTGTEPEGGGAYVSVPSWKRTIPQRHRLVAGRCRACGALAFPPDGACHACSTMAGYDEGRLPGTGTVEAVTVIGQGGAPPEFVEQQQRAGAFAVAVVAFDGPEDDGDRARDDGEERERGEVSETSDTNGTSGASEGADESEHGDDTRGSDETVSAPAQVVDSPASSLAVGDRVVAVPRRIYEQEGVGRYGFKVVPADERR